MRISFPQSVQMTTHHENVHDGITNSKPGIAGLSYLRLFKKKSSAHQYNRMALRSKGKGKGKATKIRLSQEKNHKTVDCQKL